MEQIKIDIVPVGVAPVAHASQFDNSRQIRFNLFNQGTPYTLTGAETVTMVVNGEEENITNTSDNYVIWDVAEADCAEAGVIGCEIRIVLGSMLIGSKNFFLEVEMDPYNGKNIRTITVGPADICTFETTLPEPLQSVLVNVTATGGNGTPDNPNPINGYSSANITRCGVNLFDISNINDTHGSNTLSINGDEITITWANGATIFDTKNKQIFKAGNYIVKGSGTNTNKVRAYFYKASDNTQLTNIYINTGTVITLTDDFYIAIGGRYDDLDTATFTLQLEVGSTAHDYSPYNGQTYTIAFGQTVYGGVLDVTRGKLHVTWGGDNIGSLNWSYSSADNWFQVSHTTHKHPQNNALCSCYPVVYTLGADFVNESLAMVNGYLAIKDSTFGNDADALKTALNGQMVVYELATPFDIDLTPEVISAIVGTNNVFADCGQTTVKYLAEG